MSEYGVKVTLLELSFVEFVKMCGLTPVVQTKNAHPVIPLFKLASVYAEVPEQRPKDGHTHLVQSAYYDISERDIVEDQG